MSVTRRHWLLLVTVLALALAAYVAFSGPGKADAAGITQPRMEQAMEAPGHFYHDVYRGCHWWQYWGGSWHGPLSTRPYAPAGVTVWRSPQGNLYQCY